MGQSDIVAWLGKMRATGSHDFFTVSQIRKGCARDSGALVVNLHVNRLHDYGYLEVRYDNPWRRRYRLKQRYVGGVA